MKAYDLTVTGSLNITEQISGSSTSTGSFGHGFIADNLHVGAQAKVFTDGTNVRFMNRADGDTLLTTFDSNEKIHLDSSGFIKVEVNGSEAIRIDSSQNVGIGQNTPARNLEISDSNANSEIELSTWSTTDTHKSGLLFSKSSNGSINTLAETANGEDLGRIVAQGVNSSGNSVYSATQILFEQDASSESNAVPGRISFWTADSSGGGVEERLRIDNSGKIGIGTTSPQRELDVVGDIRASGDVIADRFIVSSSVSHITMSFSSGSTIFGDDPADTHQFTGSLNVSGSAHIIGGGNVDLRADNVNLDWMHGDGDQVLRIEIDSGNDAYFSITGTNDYYFRTNNSTALKIDGSQNLSLTAAKRLYFDDSGHTYISETSNDVLDVYVGGANALKISPTEIQIPRYLTHMGDGNNYLDFGTDTLTVVNDGGDTLQLTSDHFVRVVQGNLGIGVSANSDFQLQVSGSGIQQTMLHSVDNTARLNLRGHTQADIVFKDTGGGSDTKILQQTLGADVFKFRTLTDAGAIGIDPVLEFDLATGNSIFGGNKVSGSATTTGSFGRIQVPQSHYLEFLAGGVGTAHKWQIFNNASNVLELTSTAYGGTVFFVDATGGGVNVAANLDVGAGIDVTGDGNFNDNVIVDTGAVYARRAGGTLAGAGSNLGGMENLSLGSQTADKGTRIKMDSGNSTGEFIMQARGSSGYSDGQIEFFRRSASSVFDHLLTISGDGKQISGSQYSTGSFGRIEANVAGIHITTSSMAIDNDLTAGGDVTFGNDASDQHSISGSLSISGSGDSVFVVEAKRATVPRFRVDNDSDNTIGINCVPSNALVDIRSTGNDRFLMSFLNGSGADIGGFYDGGGSLNLFVEDASSNRNAQIEGSTGDFISNAGNFISKGANKVISGSATSTGSFGRLHLISVNDNALQSKFEALHIVNNINGGNGTGHTGEIVFRAGGGFPGHPAGRIGSVTEASYGASGTRDAGLFFSTVDSSANAADVERMRIDASGKIGMGSSDPAANLHVKGDEPEFFIQHSGTSGNDKTKISFGDIHGQVHAQMFTQLKDDTSGGPYDSEFHIQTAAGGTLADRIVIEEDGATIQFPTANAKISGSSTSTGSFGTMFNAKGHIETSLGGGLNVSFGYEAGKLVTNASSSVFIGTQAGKSITTGNQNIAIGADAMNSGTGTVTGDNNIAIGASAGDALTSGNVNILIGKDAGGAITTAFTNIAIGINAFDAATTGIHSNVAIGDNAMGVTTGADMCTVVGSNAGGNGNMTSDADGTVLIGRSAGSSLTSGQGNIAFGYEALDAEDDGDYNTAIGYQALTDQTGVSGVVANTAVGYYAGTNVTTGIKNTMLGAYAGYTSLLVDNTVLLGYNAGGSAAMTADADGTIAVGFSALAQLTSGQRNIAIGYEALDALKVGDDNIALGYKALTNLGTSTFANRNIAIGTYALLSAGNNNINDNIAMGYGALSQSVHSDGDNNVAIGTNAMSDLTAGAWGNVAIGQDALRRINHADSQGSVAVGFGALTANVSGIGNVAVGFQALKSEDDGDHNTAVGYEALEDQTGTTGTVGNTAMGYKAGKGVVTGKFNTFIGGNSGETASGSAVDENAALGYAALGKLNSGSRNTALGTAAGQLFQNASDIVAVGYYTLANANTSTDIDGCVAIGSLSQAENKTGQGNVSVGKGALQTDVNGDNNTAIGHEALKVQNGVSGNVGNTAVGNNALHDHTSGQQNTVIGAFAMSTNLTGRYNTVVGYEAFAAANGAEDNHVIIGRSAGYNLDGAQNCVMVGRSTQGSAAGATNQNVFGYHAAGQVDNSVTLGNADVTKVYMSEDGDAEMYANGTINTSDRRLKENIEDSDLGLEFVNKLRPVSYKFKKDKQSNKLKYGIIAQEVQEVLKETNNEDFAGITDKGDYLGADYVQFIAPLIKSVQELTEMVKSQQKEIEELKNKQG